MPLFQKTKETLQTVKEIPEQIRSATSLMITTLVMSIVAFVTASIAIITLIGSLKNAD